VRAVLAGILIVVALAATTATTAVSQGTPRLAIDLPALAADPAPGQPAATPGDTRGPGPAIRSLDILADGQTRDLLRNGFPARLHFRVELWHAGGLFNALDGTREWDVIARYDPLDKQYRAARLVDQNVTVLGDFPQFPALAAALAAPYTVPLVPGRGGGKYYYNAVVDVEMLSLNDLDEVERWLRGELSPAVRGQRNPGGVLGRGLRTLFVRLLGAERRHYEVRSKTFKAR
jgi:hypothetical protein